MCGDDINIFSISITLVCDDVDVVDADDVVALNVSVYSIVDEVVYSVIEAAISGVLMFCNNSIRE